MQLSNISIRNFRRLKDVEIDFEGRETLFVGPNNSGKTSATAAVRSFLGNRDFKIHDFSMSCILNIDKFDPAQCIDLPSIELDIWFQVDPKSISFGRVFDLATSLSEDFSEIGMRCALAVEDVSELWAEYDNTFPIKEDGERKQPLSHFLELNGNLKKYFGLHIFSLEKGQDEVVATPIDPKNGRKILNSLLRVDFVDAQRNIDDENATRSNRLSEAFATYYRRNLEQAELAEQAVAVIEENNENLTSHYDQHFEPLMNMIGGLGLPSGNDRAMRVVSKLSSEAALRGNTELFYVDPNTKHELPEGYNGLGFKNLVFMAIQIDHFYRQWLSTEENRPMCQIIFIEEPEVHLHAQVQQTFIRQMWDVLTAEALKDEDKPQLAITTHSSHILDTVDFAKIRYFRRQLVGEGSECRDFECTTVHSLRQFQPDPVDVDGHILSSEEALLFLQKYLRLTHCDLFFSDAAILVEGAVEKLLLPRMIDGVAEDLNRKYLTVLEVGGAYAMRFAGLLEFLEIPYLVITDIDSVHPSNNRKNCIATEVNAVTANATIRYFFKENRVGKLANEPYNNCIQAEGMRFVAYQKPVSVEIEGQPHLFHGRTLEEAFVYENIDLFKEGAFSIGIELPKEPKELHQAIWSRIKSSTFKKTEFAMDVLSFEPSAESHQDGSGIVNDATGYWKVPCYIAEGLQWLSGRLSQKQEAEQ